jgi:hypothetical protein
MFGYDWAKGYVAPYRNSHGEAYTTPHEAIDELLDVIMNSRLLSSCHNGSSNDSSLLVGYHSLQHIGVYMPWGLNLMKN